MTTSVVIKAELREKAGKGAARSLRRNERIPAIIYGKGEKEIMISLPRKELQALHGRFNVATTLVELEVQDKKYHVLPKQVSLHPVTDLVEHIDFVVIGKESKIRVKVPLMLTGTEKSPGLKRGGTLNFSRRFVECVVNKGNIPESIKVDVSNMGIGDAIRFCDLQIESDITVKENSSDRVLIKMVGKRALKGAEDSAASAENKASEGEGSSKDGGAKASGAAK